MMAFKTRLNREWRIKKQRIDFIFFLIKFFFSDWRVNPWLSSTKLTIYHILLHHIFHILYNIVVFITHYWCTHFYATKKATFFLLKKKKTTIKRVPDNLTSIIYSWIKDLRFNLCIHQKLIDILV